MRVIDIETHSQARALAAQYPMDDRQPPENYKKPETIAKWYESDQKKWKADLAKNAALSPRLGRIVAVGWDTGSAGTLVDLNESGERELVSVALEIVEGAASLHPRSTGRDQLVTFNGHPFDLPYLHTRAAILGVRIPYRAGDFLRRYSNDPHADLRMILSNWDMRAEGTLGDWCAAFGIPLADDSSGANIGGMVERGDVEGIRRHCASDVAATRQLAQRLQQAGLV